MRERESAGVAACAATSNAGLPEQSIHGVLRHVPSIDRAAEICEAPHSGEFGFGYARFQ